LKSAQQLESLVVITGMSGSGKRSIFKVFEDVGYFCVDNLPTPLIPRLIDMTALSRGAIKKLAIVVDARLRESVSGFAALFRRLKKRSFKTTIIFVDAADDVLARRYSETRRVHPLAREGSPLDGIQAERRKLSEIRALADVVVDTSDFTVHDLRRFVYENLVQAEAGDKLNIAIVSFGFKHGLPYNSDLVFDVRFLPNPHFVPHLKHLTGNDPEVVQYMTACPETQEVLDKITDMLEYFLPRYLREGKTYLTVSIGCTGGQHRSVMIANELKKRLEKDGRKLNLIHRDLNLK